MGTTTWHLGQAPNPLLQLLLLTVLHPNLSDDRNIGPDWRS